MANDLKGQVMHLMAGNMSCQELVDLMTEYPIGEQLVKLSNDNGGRDNISVILIAVKSLFPAGAGLLHKIRHIFG